MIRFVASDEEPLLLESCSKFGIFGTKIYTQYQTYGAQSGIADFWLIWDDGHPVGIVSRLGGTLTVAGAGNPQELAEFLSAVGGDFAELECPLAESINAFLRAQFSASWILRGGQRAQYARAEDGSAFCAAPELRAVYTLLCRAQHGFAQTVRYDAWLAESSHKVRHGLAEIFTLYVENKPISTASILFHDETRALLAGVATDPDFTGQGYGRHMVRDTAERSLEQGRIPFVLIERDELRQFYVPCGFVPCGRWARISLRGTGKEPQHDRTVFSH